MTLRSKTLQEIASKNAVAICNVPEEPPEGYHGLPDVRIANQLNNNGFFDRVGYCNGNHPSCDLNRGSCDVKIFKLSQTAVAIIERIEEPNTLPCGHQGLHTITGGETYTCQRETCGKRFDKETVEKTFFATEEI
jgi:hypothetical protein